MSQKERQAAGQAINGLLKGLRFSVKSADQGTVEAVFSTFNVKDKDGDVTVGGAFEDGAEVLISSYNHGTWGDKLPVGKGVIRVDDTKAWLEGQFWLDTLAGSETFKAVKNAGDLQEWSYGYNVLETGEVTDEMYQLGVWRVLKKLKVFEVSPVLVGAGVGTYTQSIKSASKDEGADNPPTAEEIALKAASIVAAQQAERVAEAAAKALSSETMREFARFQKTRARLLVGTDAG